MTALEHVSYLAGAIAVGIIVWRALRRPRRSPTDNVFHLRDEARRRGLRAANRG